MSVCNVSPTIPILDILIEDPVINCTFSRAISKIVEKGLPNHNGKFIPSLINFKVK